MSRNTPQPIVRLRPLTALAFAAALAGAACGFGEPRTEAGAPDAGAAAEAAAAAPRATPRVTISEPADGAELDGASITIAVATENIALAPAGDSTPGTGHLHLFVNQPVTPGGAAIPIGTEGIVHLGQAQSSQQLTGLAPGDYTVVAVLGDMLHRTIDPQAMDTVRFRVRAPN